MAATDTTIKEMQELRKGRGLAADDLRNRVGPRIQALCDITEADPPHAVRRAIVLKLTELCEELDEDRRLAARIAFNLHPPARGNTLEDRLAWLASYMRRDPKTAIRRVDSAFRMLAELIDELARDGASLFSPTGWYNHTVRTTLFMDRALPVVREERRIIATADGLRELEFYFSAPRPEDFDGPEQIEAEALYGGRITSFERPATGYAKFTVELTDTLNLGDPHDYCIEATSYPREWMRPYYEVAPILPVAHFFLRVKFETTQVPRHIRRFDGVPRFAMNEFSPTGELVCPNRFGEVITEFHALKPHLSYGVRWE